MFNELIQSATRLEDRACNLKLSCEQNNKKMIVHYVEEIAFWSNAILADYFEIQKEVNK